MPSPTPTRAEGLAYVFVAVLAALVIANAAKAPTDPRSPDHLMFERGIR